jgi:hypothetical protein
MFMAWVNSNVQVADNLTTGGEVGRRGLAVTGAGAFEAQPGDHRHGQNDGDLQLAVGQIIFFHSALHV